MPSDATPAAPPPDANRPRCATCDAFEGREVPEAAAPYATAGGLCRLFPQPVRHAPTDWCLHHVPLFTEAA